MKPTVWPCSRLCLSAELRRGDVPHTMPKFLLLQKSDACRGAAPCLQCSQSCVRRAVCSFRRQTSKRCCRLVSMLAIRGLIISPLCAPHVTPRHLGCCSRQRSSTPPLSPPALTPLIQKWNLDYCMFCCMIFFSALEPLPRGSRVCVSLCCLRDDAGACARERGLRKGK
jgi:hypothetical protein